MVKLHFVDTGANIPRRLEPGVSISLVIDPSDEFITIDSTGVFAGDVTIGGDLTVNGTTTTLDTQNMTIEDNIIVLNQGETGAGVTLGSSSLRHRCTHRHRRARRCRAESPACRTGRGPDGRARTVLRRQPRVERSRARTRRARR